MKTTHPDPRDTRIEQLEQYIEELEQDLESMNQFAYDIGASLVNLSMNLDFDYTK